MREDLLQEIIVSLIIIVLIVALLNPFSFWMPDMILVLMIVGLLVSFSIFASFIWKESVKDERENLHRLVAGRIAFLVGSGTLVAAIAIEGISHKVDVWLVIVLGSMILAKTLGLIYAKNKY